jgi:hypothetical protein
MHEAPTGENSLVRASNDGVRAMTNLVGRVGLEPTTRRIRPYGQPASRLNAFEELSSILLRPATVCSTLTSDE